MTELKTLKDMEERPIYGSGDSVVWKKEIRAEAIKRHQFLDALPDVQLARFDLREFWMEFFNITDEELTGKSLLESKE